MTQRRPRVLGALALAGAAVAGWWLWKRRRPSPAPVVPMPPAAPGRHTVLGLVDALDRGFVDAVYPARAASLSAADRRALRSALFIARDAMLREYGREDVARRFDVGAGESIAFGTTADGTLIVTDWSVAS